MVVVLVSWQLLDGSFWFRSQVFALCEALYDDQAISSLDLSFNNLNDTAAQALSRLLKVKALMP